MEPGNAVQMYLIVLQSEHLVWLDRGLQASQRDRLPARIQAFHRVKIYFFMDPTLCYTWAVFEQKVIGDSALICQLWMVFVC